MSPSAETISMSLRFRRHTQCSKLRSKLFDFQQRFLFLSGSQLFFALGSFPFALGSFPFALGSFPFALGLFALGDDLNISGKRPTLWSSEY